MINQKTVQTGWPKSRKKALKNLKLLRWFRYQSGSQLFQKTHFHPTGQMIIDPSIKDYFGDLQSQDYNIQNIDTSTTAYRASLEYCQKNNVTIKCNPWRKARSISTNLF